MASYKVVILVLSGLLVIDGVSSADNSSDNSNQRGLLDGLVSIVSSLITGGNRGPSGAAGTTSRTTSTTTETSINSNGNGIACGVGNADGLNTDELVRLRGILKYRSRFNRSSDDEVPDRIVGGREARPGEYPHQVRLKISYGAGSAMCGGSVLSSRWVLTAAHCMFACVPVSPASPGTQYNPLKVHPSSYTVYSGDYSRKNESDGQHEHRVDKVVAHEKYKACSNEDYGYDIGLLRTTSDMYPENEPLMTSKGYGSVNRVCVPAQGYEWEGKVTATGWGTTEEDGKTADILQTVDVNTIPTAECQKKYDEVDETQICAGTKEGGKDSCQGDSGGPLVAECPETGRMVVLGITSYGEGCARKDAPGVYTKVSAYRNWIETNTGRSFAGSQMNCQSGSGTFGTKP